jgi:uncharacterized membrane protein
VKLSTYSAAAMVGFATGSRSATGLAAFAHTRYAGTPHATLAHRLSGAAIIIEAILDKLPTTRSRLKPPSVVARMATGGLAAYGIAHRSDQENTVVAVGIGWATALAGSYAGARYRSACTDMAPAIPCALAEDAVAGVLAYTAVTRSTQ